MIAPSAVTGTKPAKFKRAWIVMRLIGSADRTIGFANSVPLSLPKDMAGVIFAFKRKKDAVAYCRACGYPESDVREVVESPK